MKHTHRTKDRTFGRASVAECTLLKAVDGGPFIAVMFGDGLGGNDMFPICEGTNIDALFEEMPKAVIGDFFGSVSNPSQTWVCLGYDSETRTASVKWIGDK